jgi:hypothetical protein
MSVKTEDYYSIICDYPGCKTTAQEGGDYSAWADVGAAIDEAENGEWLCIDGGGEYCPSHWWWPNDEDDGDDEKRVPVPDTFEWRLKDAMDTILSSAIGRLDRLSYAIGQSPKRRSTW